jgi:hypothetical protein
MLTHNLFGMKIPLKFPGRCTVAAAVGLLIGAISGCAESSIERPKTFPVGGKVTYKGQPVPKGTVTFQPDDGQAAVGEIQADGSYRLTTFAPGDGALPGHHRVFVIANTADPSKMPGSSPGWTPPKDLVPKKYNTAKTSGLEATVSQDKKDIDFNLDD